MSSCAPRRPKRPKKSSGIYHRSEKVLSSLNAIVSDYIENHRNDAQKELSRYRRHMDIRELILTAARSTNRDGKKLSHQRRISPQTLSELGKELVKRYERLECCKNFEELMTITEKVGKTFWKKPGLTIYDTTHRIGAYLGIEPDLVYLHTGTRAGAIAMGFKGTLRTISPEQLPRAFARLRPYEIEDCLCLYVDELKQVSHFQGKGYG